LGRAILGAGANGSKTMSALDVAQRYFDGWNQHDAGFLVATFDPDGTYRDPPTEAALSGQAIGAYASSLFTAFPALSFELAAAPVADADSVTARWIMRGTNTGPFGGGPATGRTIAFPGVDFIRVRDGHVASVEGYFDRRGFVEQLGLQVMVQPYEMGPRVLRLERTHGVGERGATRSVQRHLDRCALGRGSGAGGRGYTGHHAGAGPYGRLRRVSRHPDRPSVVHHHRLGEPRSAASAAASAG